MDKMETIWKTSGKNTGNDDIVISGAKSQMNGKIEQMSMLWYLAGKYWEVRADLTLECSSEIHRRLLRKPWLFHIVALE